MQFSDRVGDAKCDIRKRRLHGGGRFPALRLAIVAIDEFDQYGLGGGGEPQSVATMTWIPSGAGGVLADDEAACFVTSYSLIELRRLRAQIRA